MKMRSLSITAGCILVVPLYLVFAQLAPAEQRIEPIRTGAKGEAAVKFQQKIEKFFEVDGRLLMPLGVYGVTSHIRKTDEMKRLMKNGISFIQKYDSYLTTSKALRDVESATKAGAPLALNFPRGYLDNDLSWWENYLRPLLDKEQIIIWYLPEEPGEKNLPRLKELTELLHKLDKSGRPIMTYLKSVSPSVLTEASKFMDCVVYGAYPGHGWTGGARLRIARRMDRAYSCGAAAVIAAQEAFETKSGWTKPEHVIFDTYLALIYGARGLWWFTYAQMRNNPELLEAVLARTRILNGPEHLGEVFLKGDDNQNIQARVVGGPTFFPDSISRSMKMYLGGKIYPSINWRAFNHRGNTYLIMVNGCEMIKESNPNDNEEDLTVKIEFRGFNADSKIALLDGRSDYSFQSDVLTVVLKPLGVAVFKITP